MLRLGSDADLGGELVREGTPYFFPRAAASHSQKPMSVPGVRGLARSIVPPLSSRSPPNEYTSTPSFIRR